MKFLLQCQGFLISKPTVRKGQKLGISCGSRFIYLAFPLLQPLKVMSLELLPKVIKLYFPQIYF